MGVYVEPAEQQFNIETDWREIIADNGPASTHLSLDTQEASLVGIIPWNKQRSAARYFLGFAYTDTAAPWRLHRENPKIHPTYSWLRAANISFTPIAPKRNDENELPKIDAFQLGDDTIPYVAYYDSVIATVHFRAFRQFFRPDSAIATNQDEWKRNVWFDTEPQVEALSVDGISQMHFIETSEPPNPPGPDIDAKFPAPLAQIQAKTGFIIHWTSVPWDYLSSDPDVFIPDKILNCVGKLNETPFIDPLNWVKGTLYMRPPRFNVKPYPVPSTDPAKPLFGVDLEIPIDFFDPINGATGSSYAGYDLLPFRGDGKYYAAKRENGIDGILPYADFNKIFENVEE